MSISAIEHGGNAKASGYFGRRIHRQDSTLITSIIEEQQPLKRLSMCLNEESICTEEDQLLDSY